MSKKNNKKTENQSHEQRVNAKNTAFANEHNFEDPDKSESAVTLLKKKIKTLLIEEAWLREQAEDISFMIESNRSDKDQPDEGTLNGVIDKIKSLHKEIKLYLDILLLYNSHRNDPQTPSELLDDVLPEGSPTKSPEQFTRPS